MEIDMLGGAAKRPKLEQNGTQILPGTDLATLLDRLRSLLTSTATGTQPEELEDVLDELAQLQITLSASDATSAVVKSITDAQRKLQAAIVALQAAIDRFTPPPGYKPPPAGDEAFVRGLLSYAHRLSYTSSAPMGYQPGQPLYFFKPPAPQEAEMRVSQLHAFNKEWGARQQAEAAQRLAAAAAQAPAAAAAAAAKPQPEPHAAPAAAAAAALPAGDLAAMAAQLGLDAKQLLASMPPGWKPGDPIPIAPPSAAAPAAAAPAQQQQQQTPAAAQPQQAQRAVSPAAEEERSPKRAAPLLTGIFLDDFGQYDYDVSSGEDGDSDGDSDDDSD